MNGSIICDVCGLSYIVSGGHMCIGSGVRPRIKQLEPLQAEISVYDELECNTDGTRDSLNKQRRNEINLIGKNVIVRASVAGVHAGTVEEFDPATQTIKLKNAYRLWRFYTRDNSGSISDVAVNGLKPGCDHQIGARLDFVVITNPPGLEIAGMTDAAYASIEEWKNG